jgi:IS30 family transposase
MKAKHHFTLTKHDRERIEKWTTKHTPAGIARRIGCVRSTISRELVRGIDVQGVYRAEYAHKKAVFRIRNRKLGKRKILMHKDLQDYVHRGLQEE